MVPRGKLDLAALLLLQAFLVPLSNPYRGKLREGPGFIRLDGSRHRELPAPADARRDADRAVRDLESAIASGAALLEPEETANDIEFGLSAAHLFMDGNGRLARAVGNWVLLRAGYQLVNDPKRYCRERIHAYYFSLAAGEAGDRTRFREFFAGLVASCYRVPQPSEADRRDRDSGAQRPHTPVAWSNG